MKSLKYTGDWAVGIKETGYPEVTQPDDVIVQIEFTGICGTDIGIVTGDYNVAVPGVTIGHESSGVVYETGSAVTHVKPGDRVVINPTSYCGECRMCRSQRINHCEQKFGTESGVSADGTFAEFYRTADKFVHKLPDSVSLEAATLTEPLSCVITGLRKIPADVIHERVIVFGAGPMGLLYTWALTLKGYAPVLIENSDLRTNFALSCIPPSTKIYPTLERYFQERECDSIDLVVDTTSGQLEKLYPCLSPGSTYISVGLKSKNQTINTIKLADKSLNIVGSIDSKAGSFIEAFELICNEVIPVEKIVSHKFPLSQFQNAFSILGLDLANMNYTGPVEKCCKVLISPKEIAA